MAWYYVEDGKQAGPVSEEEFAQLVATARIVNSTLVWREGMPQWVPYSQVRPAAPGSGAIPPLAPLTATPGAGEVVCSQCRGIFPKSETIQYGTEMVCAQCKPVFLQKLREGAVSQEGLNYAGFWIRVGAKFVDGLVFIVLFIPWIVITAMTSDGGEEPSGMQLAIQLAFQVVYSLLGLAYNTFMIGKYQATLGKMACGLRVISPETGKISYARALGRALAEILSGVTCYIGYIIVAFDGEKRALHDHICNTRVIKIR